MVAWSSIALRNITRYNLTRKAFACLKNESRAEHEIQNAITTSLVRGHSTNTMTIVPSRFRWNKFKDLLNFYLLLGAIPLGLLITYVNIFIGPAKLAVIPEGYEPKPWEYHPHPITRFFAKYATMSRQESHERNLHNIFYHNERYRIRQLEKKIEKLMKERLDYQAYYFKPRSAKYDKMTQELAEAAEKDTFQSHGWVH